MKIRHWLLSAAMGSVVFTLSALPSRAVSVPGGAFAQACVPGSGVTEVSDWFGYFLDYLAASPDGACYIGDLKFSNFDFGPPPEGGGGYQFLGISQGKVPGSSGQLPLTQTSIGLFVGDGFIWDEARFNYSVSGWSEKFDGFSSWQSFMDGYGDRYVTTSSSPSPFSDPACDPVILGGSSIGTWFKGPICEVPAGLNLTSFAITNVASVGPGDGQVIIISNLISAFDLLPPPGTDPANPFLPSPPQGISEPWVFDPVVVNDPGQVWWFDPEVSIGYIYNVADPLGPLFDQYTAPDLPFNDTYELLSSGGGACGTNPEDFTTSLATITQNVPYDFTTPLACFAIKGISEQNALDPLNTTAFVAGISFDKAGTVTVSQTPIPTPGPLPLAGAGMAYGWARGLRRRLRLRAQAAGG
jgi:hypothetical protein